MLLKFYFSISYLKIITLYKHRLPIFHNRILIYLKIMFCFFLIYSSYIIASICLKFTNNEKLELESLENCAFDNETIQFFYYLMKKGIKSINIAEIHRKLKDIYIQQTEDQTDQTLNDFVNKLNKEQKVSDENMYKFVINMNIDKSLYLKITDQFIKMIAFDIDVHDIVQIIRSNCTTLHIKDQKILKVIFMNILHKETSLEKIQIEFIKTMFVYANESKFVYKMKKLVSKKKYQFALNQKRSFYFKLLNLSSDEICKDSFEYHLSNWEKSFSDVLYHFRCHIFIGICNDIGEKIAYIGEIGTEKTSNILLITFNDLIDLDTIDFYENPCIKIERLDFQLHHYIIEIIKKLNMTYIATIDISSIYLVMSSKTRDFFADFLASFEKFIDRLFEECNNICIYIKDFYFFLDKKNNIGTFNYCAKQKSEITNTLEILHASMSIRNLLKYSKYKYLLWNISHKFISYFIYSIPNNIYIKFHHFNDGGIKHPYIILYVKCKNTIVFGNTSTNSYSLHQFQQNYDDPQNETNESSNQSSSTEYSKIRYIKHFEGIFDSDLWTLKIQKAYQSIQKNENGLINLEEINYNDIYNLSKLITTFDIVFRKFIRVISTSYNSSFTCITEQTNTKYIFIENCFIDWSQVPSLDFNGITIENCEISMSLSAVLVLKGKKFQKKCDIHIINSRFVGNYRLIGFFDRIKIECCRNPLLVLAYFNIITIKGEIENCQIGGDFYIRFKALNQDSCLILDHFRQELRAKHIIFLDNKFLRQNLERDLVNCKFFLEYSHLQTNNDFSMNDHHVS